MRWLILTCLALVLVACREAEKATPAVEGTAELSESWTVRVTGSMTTIRGGPPAAFPSPRAAPMPFKGSILVLRSDGTTQQESVQGTVPKEYTVSGRSVTVTMQKDREDGELTVTLLRGSSSVQTGHTTADYGVVTLSAR